MPRLHNRPYLTPQRRALRRHATAEAVLWKALRRRQLDGRRFRRQHSVGRGACPALRCGVLDFYCAEARLAVELDGAVHADPIRAAADAARQAWLEARGLRVLRFENRAVVAQLDLVLAAIAQACARATGGPLPPAPSPQGREGENATPGSRRTAGMSATAPSAPATPNNLSPSPPGEGAGGRAAP